MFHKYRISLMSFLFLTISFNLYSSSLAEMWVSWIQNHAPISRTALEEAFKQGRGDIDKVHTNITDEMTQKLQALEKQVDQLSQTVDQSDPKLNELKNNIAQGFAQFKYQLSINTEILKESKKRADKISVQLRLLPKLKEDVQSQEQSIQQLGKQIDDSQQHMREDFERHKNLVSGHTKAWNKKLNETNEIQQKQFDSLHMQTQATIQKAEKAQNEIAQIKQELVQGQQELTENNAKLKTLAADVDKSVALSQSNVRRVERINKALDKLRTPATQQMQPPAEEVD